eukprot:TRINITY_DN93010_c0_g1_i1.p1 TRINITY_DN93010_c0_g1~~TRINITY_DN93010_c0_g1_i1.p1  ORF type:complete len:636 (+),score=190.65 TRINITY_DN93010_c0_g1_i1:180-1910(+)
MEAEAELKNREAERAQLLQLLLHKEQLLERETLTAERLRAVLRSARSCAEYYLLLCSFRCWREMSQRAVARKRLLEVKERRVEAVLRHACGALSTGLRQAAARRLADAMHGLWLHAAAQRLGLTSEVAPSMEPTAVAALGTSLEADKELPDDQVLFDTPRNSTAGEAFGKATAVVLSTPPSWKGPRFCRSPYSEASTRATSSSSYARGGDSNRSSLSVCMGAARLAIALEASVVRRLAWSLRKLQAVPARRCLPPSWESKLPMRRAERRCEKLEASLSAQATWREEAERRIVKMADRGEKLERQRAALLQRCEATQKALNAEEQKAARLKVSLAAAEEATEVMNRKTQALELKGAELLTSARAERSERQRSAAQHREALAEARQELQRLRSALRASSSERGQPDAEAVCQELRSAWQRERDQWAAACDELRKRTADAQEEAAAARRAEGHAEAAAASARADAACEQAAARRELHSEARVFEELQAQLESRLVKAAKHHGELRAEAAEAMASSQVASKGHVDEAAAYQALVARLRSQLRWERSERESCDQALETLRGSYRLLLKRQDGVGQTHEHSS